MIRPLTVHLRALRAMHADAARCAVETGGLCVGPDAYTITEYLPSGPNAERTHSSYEIDVAYLQPKLEAAEDRGLGLVGIHHVHPSGCTQLSGVDRATARAILTDPAWAIDRLALPLTVRSRSGFSTAFFVAENAGKTIVHAPVLLVDENDGEAAGEAASTALPVDASAAHVVLPGDRGAPRAMSDGRHRGAELFDVAFRRGMAGCVRHTGAAVALASIARPLGLLLSLQARLASRWSP